MLLNDSDPFCCSWLDELVDQGHLPKATINSRPIEQLTAEDCHPTSHFFAGIGGWPLALKIARWPEHVPVWTGSCPCQSLSEIQQQYRNKTNDLWPVWFGLIKECGPPIIFGEQVARGSGLQWLSSVRSDLEAAGYAVGAANLCAAGVGAPHRRQRLFWVAIRDSERDALVRDLSGVVRGLRLPWADDRGCGVADAYCDRREDLLEPCTTPKAVGVGSPWGSYELVALRDGTARPVEPGTRPMAHGLSSRVVRVCPACGKEQEAPCCGLPLVNKVRRTNNGRVGQLTGYGNSIVPQLGAIFVRTVVQILVDPSGSL
jgi:DNA (cytosine-5)-methyltransferase 1